MIDLACFDFVPLLLAVAEMKQLVSLTLQGNRAFLNVSVCSSVERLSPGLNQVDLEEEDMVYFLRNLARNCSKLQVTAWLQDFFKNGIVLMFTK